MRKIVLIFLIAALSGFVSLAQRPATIEQNLTKGFARINYWMENESSFKDDSLQKANDNFQKMLLTYTSKYPETLSQKFKGIQGLNIVTSEDGLLRIYSWDTGTGGTMRFFKEVVQYKTGDVTRSLTLTDVKREGEAGYTYQAIYSLTVPGKKYYLVNYKGIYSSKDIGEGVRVFSIDNNLLNTKVKLIKTQSGMHNSIDYSYDFFSVVDWKVRPSIQYNAGNKEIKIPLVTADQKVTKKFITYKFTGKYFEKVRI
jgi:hypothetical protein